MRRLKKILAGADDDYLIGLTNKGIVKRAYKDLEKEVLSVQEMTEEYAQVKVGEEICRITEALGDSSCSCVSRNICKHIIMAVLYLKSRDELLGFQTEEGSEGLLGSQSEECSEGLLGSQPEGGSEELPSVTGFPLQKAARILGAGGVRRLCRKLRTEIMPSIRETSVITVEFPEEQRIVKLLEPIEYSSCSCHKKEMCVHKAEAVIWFQLHRGILKREDIFKLEGRENSYDLEKVRLFAAHAKEILEELFEAGLSRISPDTPEAMERLAVMSHIEGLPAFERQFRSLGAMYERYFKRSAAFIPEHLAIEMSRMYQQADLLFRADTEDQIRPLAGTFKEAYEERGDLKLIGIGSRSFKSTSGYAGETYYFIEEITGKWYTYTKARPTFYEEKKRRASAVFQSLPWGLEIPVEQLTELRFELKNAKANSRNSLSSSSGSRAEITGKRRLKGSEITEYFFDDFKILYEKRLKGRMPSWLKEQDEKEARELVFLKPDRCEHINFDQVLQQFTMDLKDPWNHSVTIEIRYSKEEASVISRLERIMRKIERKGVSLPYFVGEVYSSQGQIKLYPIACLDREEIEENE